jgi:hypothetical protein
MGEAKKQKTDKSIFNAVVIPPEKIAEALSLKEGEEVSYNHKYYEDKNLDVRIIEVSRSQDPIPYSVVIHEFSKRGLPYFFEALYSAQSWASEDDYANQKYSFDTHFCKELWREWQLEGDFNPEKIEHDLEHQYLIYRRPLKEAVERTYGIRGKCTHSSVHYMTQETIDEIFAKHQQKPNETFTVNLPSVPEVVEDEEPLFVMEAHDDVLMEQV